MLSEDAIRGEGTIREVLPNGLFRVELPNGHRVLAHVPGRLRLEYSGLLPGEKVVMKMSAYDLSRGCITNRQK